MGDVRSHALGAIALCALFWLPCAVRAEDRVAKLEAELATAKGELADTKTELAKMQSLVQDLARKVDDFPGRAAEPAQTASLATSEQTARLAPVNADNPAVSFVVDGKWRSNTQGDEGVGFLLGNAELFISAPIDPYLRGYASINATTDEKFDVEEAALITTSLPWNLTVKGGRFFSDVGRFPHWHDEALPFAERPASIERMFGGETRSEGIETSWLAPTDQYIDITAGVYNAIGEGPDESLTNFVGQPSYGELTYLVHPHTYFDLTDALNVELGSTFFAAPSDTRRRLYGYDITLRYQPGTSEFYQGSVVGSEWYWNDQEFFTADGTGERFRANGGYAYLENFFGRRFSAGLLFDHAESVAGAKDRENTYTGFVTWMPSEFHRLRLELDEIDRTGKNDQRVWLQWTAFLGSHSHGFAQR